MTLGSKPLNQDEVVASQAVDEAAPSDDAKDSNTNGSGAQPNGQSPNSATSNASNSAHNQNPASANDKTNSTRQKRASARTLRKEWEDAYGKQWPKDPNDPNRNQDVAHKTPLADGGTNDLDNIGPQPHNEHMQEHMQNGDFKRWGGWGGGKSIP